MILIKSFISSFEINKVNLFPGFIAPFTFFFSNLFIAFETKLLTNPGKLANGIATFVSAFLLKWANQKSKVSPD